MHRQLLVLITCWSAAVISGYSQEPSDKMKLPGIWTCMSATVEGKVLAEETVKVLRLTLTADRYKTERGEQVLFDSTYTIDATKNPKTIDMIGTEGDVKGKAGLGIYKLDGDTLTICYVLPPNPERPATFESRADSGIYLVVWKRAK